MSDIGRVQQGLTGQVAQTAARPNAGRAAAVLGSIASAASSVLPGPGGALASMVSGGGGAAGGGSELQQMRAMQQESNTMQLQYMQLQQSVQDDNRRFSTASNVLRAGHDTQKAAIQNIRS